MRPSVPLSSALVVEPANHDFLSPGWKIAIGSLAASALAAGLISYLSLFRYRDITISVISAISTIFIISVICHINYLIYPLSFKLFKGKANYLLVSVNILIKL